MSRRNFLFTRSYLSKRLRESGFDVKRLKIEYQKSDERYWSILINLSDYQCNIILTCLRKSLNDEDCYFIVSSTRNQNYRIITKSAEVVSAQLMEVIDGEREIEIS